MWSTQVLSSTKPPIFFYQCSYDNLLSISNLSLKVNEIEQLSTHFVQNQGKNIELPISLVLHISGVPKHAFIKGWVCGPSTLLGLCNEHPPNTRGDIKVSHPSYLLKKLHFWKIKTLCCINFKNWYNNCAIIFPKKTLCSRDMRDVTLSFYV